MPEEKPQGTRERILAAAQELACEAGAGNLSLDAVAARAGLSKGGLLYHFPSKTALMKALVGEYLGRVDTALRAQEGESRPNALVAAYLAQFRREMRQDAPPASGLLAALAEDPGMLDPVREQERDFLDRMRANAADPELATIAFLAISGIRSMDLLNVKVLAPGELRAVLDWLERRLS